MEQEVMNVVEEEVKDNVKHIELKGVKGAAVIGTVSAFAAIGLVCVGKKGFDFVKERYKEFKKKDSEIIDVEE